MKFTIEMRPKSDIDENNVKMAKEGVVALITNLSKFCPDIDIIVNIDNEVVFDNRKYIKSSIVEPKDP